MHALYRVVRNGIHFHGLSNGAALSGQVFFPIEIGFANHSEVTGVFVSLVGSDEPLPQTEVVYSVTPFLAWDTRYIANGTYQIEVTVSFGEGAGAVEEKSSPITVTISNEIWFPEPFNRAGYLIDIQARSIHANGTYRIELYEEGQFFVFELEGQIDSEGWILDPNGNRGIQVLNYDEGTGEQYPVALYEVDIVTAAPGQSPMASPSASNPTTQRIFAEPPWPNTPGSHYTQFAIGYQPIYGNPNLGGVGRVALQTMIQGIYAFADARPGDLGAVRGTDQNPFEIYGQSQFGELIQDLMQEKVRNLYYFGHGAKNYIGNKEPKTHLQLGSLEVELFDQVLKNTYNPLDGFTTGHPFRFVFLDGCQTANGPLCKAFGIPQEKNVAVNRFLDKGLRLRSSIGWKGFIEAGVAQNFNNQHGNFIGYFFQGWQTLAPNGQFRSIQDAFDYAKTAGNTNPGGYSFASDLVIYGSPDLLWFDTLP